MHEGRHLYDLIMNIELRQLRCLVAIAEAGSFTDAAIDLGISQAAAGPARLRIGYAWSAMGRHTTPFQRRWAAEHPDIKLQLIRTNSATAGLAEGACDIAVIRTEPDQHRFRDAIVGLERRYCAMAADDPWA